MICHIVNAPTSLQRTSDYYHSPIYEEFVSQRVTSRGILVGLGTMRLISGLPWNSVVSRIDWFAWDAWFSRVCRATEAIWYIFAHLISNFISTFASEKYIPRRPNEWASFDGSTFASTVLFFGIFSILFWSRSAPFMFGVTKMQNRSAFARVASPKRSAHA